VVILPVVALPIVALPIEALPIEGIVTPIPLAVVLSGGRFLLRLVMLALLMLLSLVLVVSLLAFTVLLCVNRKLDIIIMSFVNLDVA